MKKYLLIKIGLLLLAAAAAVSAAALYYNSKLNLVKYDSSIKTTVESMLYPLKDSTGFTLPVNAAAKEKTSSCSLAQSDIYAQTDVLNILLIGTDERSEEFNVNARADSIMILSLNLKSHTAKLVSLERGIGVPIENRYDDWLTHVFRYGGAKLLLKTVKDCFKVDVDRYVRVNFSTFKKIIDSIGGVDIELTKEEVRGLNNETYTNAVTEVKVTEGLNHLNGHDTLEYCRLRFIDDDWHRIVRQRNTIQSVVKASESLNILEINNALNNVLPLVQTNLDKNEVTSILLAAPHLAGADIQQMTIPVKGTYWGTRGEDGRSLITIDFEKNAQVLKDFIYA